MDDLAKNEPVCRCALDAHVANFVTTLEEGAIEQFVRDHGEQTESSGQASALFLLSTEHKLMATVDAALSNSGLEYQEMRCAYHKIQETVSLMRKAWEKEQVEQVQGFDAEMVKVVDCKGKIQSVIKQADGAGFNNKSRGTERVSCKSNTDQVATVCSICQQKRNQKDMNRCNKDNELVSHKKQMTLDDWFTKKQTDMHRVEPVKAIGLPAMHGFSWKCGVCHHTHKHYYPTCHDCGWPRDKVFE